MEINCEKSPSLLMSEREKFFGAGWLVDWMLLLLLQ